MITETPPEVGIVQTVWWLHLPGDDGHNLTNPLAIPETATGDVKTIVDDAHAAKAVWCKVNGVTTVPEHLVCRKVPVSQMSNWERTRIRYLK
ncbi:MAG: hypothetical protein JWN70_6389 [Planctomycetaceae bacterium]|nr:hypothetical protein [Planctomycetaceae bacterium]